ncbi:MAG TPA: ferritin-like domain-containing protein [Acidimicrobiales bacterium]|nr:ferritin-like domain-containing protein [Acidimicrobiales bacterium]
MTGLDRRRFLAGTAGLAMAATACSDNKKGTGPSDDLATATMLAGLEKLTLDTYTGIGTSFTQGRLGAALPPAVVEALAVAGRQHGEHLDLWNRMLTAAGRAAITGADTALKPAVDQAVSRLVDVPGAATLALRLEDYLSQTYLKAIPTLGPDTVRAAAQILVVDEQHQAVLRYLLGLSPVGSGLVREPSAFAPAAPQPTLLTG